LVGGGIDFKNMDSMNNTKLRDFVMLSEPHAFV